MGLLNQPRKAGKEEQAHFNLVIKQAMSFITRPENLEPFVKMALKVGPGQAIAVYVKKTLDSIYMAARHSGAKVSPNTMSAAAQAVATQLAQMLAKNGVKGDPAAMVEEAMTKMQGL